MTQVTAHFLGLVDGFEHTSDILEVKENEKNIELEIEPCASKDSRQNTGSMLRF
jgi:hypothetical protein